MRNITKPTIKDILIYLSSIVFCIIPFLNFVEEYDFDGEVQTLINYYKMSDFVFGYLYIPLAVFVVITTLLKKDIMRYIMLGCIVIISGFWTYVAMKYVSEVLTSGRLYNTGWGYNLMLGSSILIIVITLMQIMKEKNTKKE